ncbi:2-amino-4-hydroxy-6-hydroxymethyldihydropteridin epyrophosphokinase [Desulfofarcimen acetoxidans DSM 771]|uniref:2-amino-4-hydroxy-6-hydroxymethyldihydropteridine diphosphokinase n=1 Tax=Desulfofarcimen acetoxidans (strain ATCC 49208 / DSM 771 / KCTC 5769 / VKM B-1644 / 5575) TaxID=485916 RepID=C8W3T6_DESAS|nr:2-amino-4-hydroxy-6-hydroxymethyldihydropteridine diphosphokinase [Desulfofarcimen acetoxidans]ACV61190.1 2-amino-4-hydroxy-6-hydroxymethyldihydropteridin epyrophosphokinase [Desulfofarcimen acetoxidans DSM 771]
MSKRAFIGVGSNMGQTHDNIHKAINLLSQTPGVEVINAAPFYETEPVGYTEQNWFVNSVIEVYADLSPQDLLVRLQEIENMLGRVRTVHWGPRTMDLDLLLYGDERVEEVNLIVPHPRLTERAFVMVPLADLAPNLVMPGGETAAILAERLKKEQLVTNAEKTGDN